jgi:hypothetical protein
LTRQQFLKWGIPAGVGIVGATIASQFLGDSSRQPSPPESPRATPSPEPAVSASNSSSSPASVDYSKLEGFLKAGQWQEADEETANLMRKAANRENEGYQDRDSIENFPCDVLSRIDRLWVDNSQGQFGFSIQKKIYIEACGGKPDGRYDEAAYQCFGDAVGWRVNSFWIAYSDVTFDTSSPKGHLPGLAAGWEGLVVVGVRGVSSLVQKFVNCSI